MKRRFAFTIYHGLVASLAIHASLAAPFVLPGWMPPPDEPEPLVVELEGSVGTTQVEEKLVQETKGEETKDKTEPTKPEQIAQSQPPQPQHEKREAERPPLPEKEADRPPPPEKEAERPSPPQETTASVPEQRPEEAKTGAAGANNVAGATERQEGQTIKADPITERELLRNYVTLLSKKVQSNLVYPDEARGARLQGVPVVSFTILPDGRIRPQTLKIETSSGMTKLDAAALKTITASAPFEPPPREMTVSIDVAFGEISPKPKGKI
jgi:protein TonB